jgi:phosphatidate cytidylyltransferase
MNMNAARPWKDAWVHRKPQHHHQLSDHKSTRALLGQIQAQGRQLDESCVGIRGGATNDSANANDSAVTQTVKKTSAFQKRMLASIVLLAGLSVVVGLGKEPGLQLLVWSLTPGLYHEATRVVERLQVSVSSAAVTANANESPATSTSTPIMYTPTTPTTAATAAEVPTSTGEGVLAQPSDQAVVPSQLSGATADTTTIQATTTTTTTTDTQKPFCNKWWWFVTYTLGLTSKTNHLVQIPDSWLPWTHLASFGMIMGGLVQVVLRLNALSDTNGSTTDNVDTSTADFTRAIRELAISHLGILLTLVPATAWMSAVHLFGKEYVLYAAFLVVINDTAAYVFGKNFGKKALLPKISPNKTWEGWMGAMVSTIMFSFPLYKALFQNSVSYDRHAFVLALYCAVIAPFGGFLASTVKRAYGKKDFGSLIAGHGGLIDRLDCQLVTAPFVYLYLTAGKGSSSRV